MSSKLPFRPVSFKQPLSSGQTRAGVLSEEEARERCRVASAKLKDGAPVIDLSALSEVTHQCAPMQLHFQAFLSPSMCLSNLLCPPACAFQVFLLPCMCPSMSPAPLYVPVCALAWFPFPSARWNQKFEEHCRGMSHLFLYFVRLQCSAASTLAD
jgi:hypothetical protein